MTPVGLLGAVERYHRARLGTLLAFLRIDNITDAVADLQPVEAAVDDGVAMDIHLLAFVGLQEGIVAFGEGVSREWGDHAASANRSFWLACG